MSARNHKRKLSNYYLMGEVQSSTILWVVFACALVCAVLGFLIFQQETSANESINDILEFKGAAADADSLEQKEFIANDLEQGKRNLIVQMLLVFVALVVVSALYVLMLTHRVAGPVYKMGLYFDKMSKGRLESIWPLRKGDLLNDYFKAFTEAHTVLRAKHVETTELLAVAQKHFNLSNDAHEKLSQHCSNRMDGLGMETKS